MGVGDGLPPEVAVGVGRLELELELGMMEETMTGFPESEGIVADWFCALAELATQ